MKANIFILAFIFIQLGVSQTTDSSFGYYPLQIGNVWHYSYNTLSLNPPNTLYYYSEIITGDTTAPNGKKYFITTKTNLSDKSSQRIYRRVDSITANVYRSWDLNSPNESLEDSLRAQAGDYFGITTCTGILQKIVLGYSTIVKSFKTSVMARHELAYGLGRISDWEDISGFPFGSTLIFAKISGAEYGTPLSVQSLAGYPSDYLLEQNYPNPFNPITKIRFAIPRDENVKLSIYNLMGQEIEVILDKYVSLGIHEITWNASEYSSGVYFYQMKTHSALKTKSLLLIK